MKSYENVKMELEKARAFVDQVKAEEAKDNFTFCNREDYMAAFRRIMTLEWVLEDESAVG